MALNGAMNVGSIGYIHHVDRISVYHVAQKQSEEASKEIPATLGYLPLECLKPALGTPNPVFKEEPRKVEPVSGSNASKHSTADSHIGTLVDRYV